MKKLHINELTVKVTEAVIAHGVDPLTAWTEHNSAYKPLIAMHKEKELQYLDEGLVNQLMKDISARVDKGELGWSMYRRIQRGIDRLMEFSRKGSIGWTYFRKVSKFTLNPYYEKIVEDFLISSDFHLNTQGDVAWVARKYFAWLISEGKHALKSVGAAEIQNFLVHCSKHLKLGSIHNTKLYLKKLYAYLAKVGLSKSNYEELLSFKAVRGTKVYPAASPGDLAQILEQVDRRIPIGKRNYAIILLGAVTGLRAIDIIRLELSDIDWQRGEIKIVQEKTGCPSRCR
jgi:integrase